MKMRRFTMLILALCLCFGLLAVHAGAATGDVEINETNFPDATFRSYVSSNFDTDGDGSLSQAEISAVTKIQVGYRYVTSMKGVEYFTNLTYLSCSLGYISSLDLSKNTALTELYCGGNKLTALDLSSNTNLEILWCNENSLTTLDLSKNTALKTVACDTNKLTSLDVSKNTALEVLDCSFNSLTSLTFGKNHTAMTELNCSYNSLSSLDVTMLPNLLNLYMGDNPMTSIDLSKNTALTDLACLNSSLNTLDVSNNLALESLYCYAGNYDGKISKLILGDNTVLLYLDCAGNQLTFLDVRANTSLRNLDCGHNQLTSLNVRNNTELRRMDCSVNKLTSLDLDSNTLLEKLTCNDNALGSLDMSSNTQLFSLDCSNNPITKLDLSANTKLNWFYCDGTQLTSLDVSNCALYGLRISDVRYTIKLDENNSYDLRLLPGDFDVTHTGSWTGGTVSGNTLTVSEGVTEVTYLYDCGDDYFVTFTLEIWQPMSVTTQPTTQKVKAGTTATFTVEAAGTDLTYQWQYKTSSDGKWLNCTATGNKTATMQVDATTGKTSYYYRCKITDGDGNVVYTNTVRLYVLGVTTQPTTQKVKAGTTATFTVSATGSNKTYQWQYKTSSSGSWKNCTATGNKSATLKVDATTGKSSYYYRCKITDSADNVVYTNTVRLYVLGVTTQPTTQTVKTGTTAKFTVAATGPNKSYQWQYKTSSSGSWKNCTATGNKSATLKVDATTGKSSYYYRCKITDSADNVVYTNTVRLYVLGVTTQPKSQTAAAGTTVKFTVVATGLNKTYQWEYRTSSTGTWKNATATGNKTATLSVPVTAGRNGYQYRCVVKDSAGNVVYSRAANLKLK